MDDDELIEKLTDKRKRIHNEADAIQREADVVDRTNLPPEQREAFTSEFNRQMKIRMLSSDEFTAAVRKLFDDHPEVYAHCKTPEEAMQAMAPLVQKLVAKFGWGTE